MDPQFSPCDESVSHLHDADRAGRCLWCKRRVNTPVPRPKAFAETEAMASYRYFYDPDFGSDKDDIY